MLSTQTCRSIELEYFDCFMFSILFSHSLAYNYADVCAFFIFFYTTFYIIHVTSYDNMCTDITHSPYTPNMSINDKSWYRA